MENNKKPDYTFIFLGVAILIAICIYNKWFFTNYFVSGDWSYNSKEVISQLTKLAVWHSFTELGGVLVTLWRYPLAIIQGLLGLAGFDTGVSDKIFFLWPIAILSVVTSFFFVKKLTKSNIGAFIGSLVFCYNSYYLSINMAGDEGITIAGIFSLIAFYLFIVSLEKNELKYFLLTALTMIAVGVYDFRLFYISTFIFLFYFIYYLAIIKRVTGIKELIHEFKYPLIFLIATILLSLYWILPIYGAGSLTANPILGRGLWRSNIFSIADALTLHHPFWNGGQTTWFVEAKIPGFFWFIPLLAFLGLVVGRKNKKILFFGFLSLLGVFLSKQIGEPFPKTYQWLYNNLLGFNAFREASKFYFLTIVGYAVLIGNFVGYFWQKLKNNKWEVLLKYAGTVAIAVLFLFNTKFVINGELGNMYISRDIPNDYIVLTNFILNQPQYFRTLWVPDVGTDWGVFDFNHPASSFFTAIDSQWENLSGSSGSTSGGEFINGKYHLNIFEQGFSQELLSVSSFKYIIIPNEDSANMLDAFRLLGKSNYIEAIGSLQYLKKIDIGTKDLVVYENENYRPHIYTTAAQETIYADVPYENVAFAQENPAEYTVHLSNISAPVFVNFSEEFDPNWKVRVGSFAWDKVFAANYFLPEAFHSESNATLNSFYIDPNYIRQNFPVSAYKVNQDGSIDMDLTIYFKPQPYLYIGLIVSGAALLACLGYLTFSLFRKKKNPAIMSMVKEKEDV